MTDNQSPELEGFEGHTPGPWEPDEACIVGGDGKAVAQTCMADEFWDVSDEEMPEDELLRIEANSKLICAAPRLLALAREQQARITALEGENERLRATVDHVRQSLTEQAAARADPTMPRLTKEVRKRLRQEAEGAYAMAEGRDDRVYSHGLSLLADWQDRAAQPTAQEGT